MIYKLETQINFEYDEEEEQQRESGGLTSRIIDRLSRSPLKSAMNSSRLEEKLNGLDLLDSANASPARFVADSPVIDKQPKVLYGNVLSD